MGLTQVFHFRVQLFFLRPICISIRRRAWVIRDQRISCPTPEKAVEFGSFPHPGSAGSAAPSSANATFQAGLSERSCAAKPAVLGGFGGGQQLSATGAGLAGITSSSRLSHHGTPQASAGVPASSAI